VSPDFKCYDIIKKTASGLEYKDDNISIKIILDDARISVKKLETKFDAVFFDPFAPKKHPEMWTTEFFQDIRETMKPGSILVTYSYARKVREGLAEAGFDIRDGPIVGRRSPATLAVNPGHQK